MVNRCLLILGIFLVGTVPQQLLAVEKIQEITNIRNLYSSINTSIKNNESKLVLYHTGRADYGPYENKSVVWTKSFPSESSAEFANSDYKARVYRIGKNIFKVNIYNIGEGWNIYEEYYFYKNGATAFVYERLDTLQGYDTSARKPLESPPFIVEKRTYFLANGSVVRRLEKAFRKKDGSKLPLNSIRRSVMANTYFKNTEELPFK